MSSRMDEGESLKPPLNSPILGRKNSMSRKCAVNNCNRVRTTRAYCPHHYTKSLTGQLDLNSEESDLSPSKSNLVNDNKKDKEVGGSKENDPNESSSYSFSFGEAKKFSSDKKISSCELCQTKFSILKRRHHCRKCARVCCSSCSKKQLPLQGVWARVCDTCFDNETSALVNAAQAKNSLDSSDEDKENDFDFNDPDYLSPNNYSSNNNSTFNFPIRSFSMTKSDPFWKRALHRDEHLLTKDDSFSNESINKLDADSTQLEENSFDMNTLTPDEQQNLKIVKGDMTNLLAASISTFQNKIVSLQTNINAKRSELLRKLVDRLTEERSRLKKKKSELFHLLQSLQQQALAIMNQNSKSAAVSSTPSTISHISSPSHSVTRNNNNNEYSTTQTQSSQSNNPSKPASSIDSRIDYFDKMLKTIEERIEKIGLEKNFPDPSRNAWKMRASAEVGMYIGARDIVIDRIKGSFAVQIDQGRLCVKISQLEAQLIVFGFKLCGKKVKGFSSLISPERVSAIIRSKNISVAMTYVPNTKDPNQHTAGYKPSGKWQVDKANTVFDIKIEKSIKGAASAPDSIIQWIIATFIPTLITNALQSVLPNELGRYLSSGRHHVLVAGSFDVKGDVHGAVWEAPLDGEGEASKVARSLLSVDGLTYSRLILLCTLIKQSKLVKSGETNLSIVSLKSLTDYVLKYSFLHYLHVPDGEFNKPSLSNIPLTDKEVKDYKSQWHEVVSTWQNAIDNMELALVNNNSTVANTNNNNNQINSKSGSSVSPSSSPNFLSTSPPSSNSLSTASTSKSIPSSTVNNITSNNKYSRPSNSFSILDLFSRLLDLDKKPLAVRVTVSKVDIQIGLYDTLDLFADLFVSATRWKVEQMEAELAKEKAKGKTRLDKRNDNQDPAKILKDAIELARLVKLGADTAFEIVRSASLTVKGNLKGGVIHEGEEDTLARVGVEDLHLKMSLPRFGYGIPPLIYHQPCIVTPGFRLSTRPSDTGELEALLVLEDPIAKELANINNTSAPSNLYTYLIDVGHMVLDLFRPTRTKEEAKDGPFVLLTLDQLKLEGSIRPFLALSRFVRIEECGSGQLGFVWAGAPNNDSKKEKEKEKSTINNNEEETNDTAPDPVSTLLLPYLCSSTHSLRVWLNLLIAILPLPEPDSSLNYKSNMNNNNSNNNDNNNNKNDSSSNDSTIGRSSVVRSQINLCISNLNEPLKRNNSTEQSSTVIPNPSANNSNSRVNTCLEVKLCGTLDGFIQDIFALSTL